MKSEDDVVEEDDLVEFPSNNLELLERLQQLVPQGSQIRDPPHERFLIYREETKGGVGGHQSRTGEEVGRSQTSACNNPIPNPGSIQRASQGLQEFLGIITAP